MKITYLKSIILVFSLCWLFPVKADPVVDQYLTSSWSITERPSTFSKKIEQEKYSGYDLYRYNNSDFHALVLYGAMQRTNKQLSDFCYSEIKLRYFYGKDFDEVNFQDHHLGWHFYKSHPSSHKLSCDEKALKGNKISAAGDLSLDEAFYILENLKVLSKKVSSKDANCMNKDVLFIYSDGLDEIELLLYDSNGKNYSLLLERVNNKLKAIECTELAS